MQIKGNLFPEIDNRAAIFIRYENLQILEQWQDYLNTEAHRCVIIKKNALTYVFIICSEQQVLQISAVYDYGGYCFKAQQCQSLNSLESTSIDIDKVTHIDRKCEFAIKPEGWKYMNPQCVVATSNLLDEIDSLDNYEVVMEELRRQEEIRLREENENEKAQKQLDVWISYVKKEAELLKWANRPFVLASSQPVIKKASVDIEISTSITSTVDSRRLEEITEIIGGVVENDKLTMTLEEFDKWRKSNEKKVIVRISGQIIVRLVVKCDHHKKAQQFKNDNNYGREFQYGLYDYETNSIELSYSQSSIEKIFEFWNRVNDSFCFRGEIPKSKVILSFSLEETTLESDEEREKRIDILADCDLYSRPNANDKAAVYLGKLSKSGSDKKHLRIKLPEEKEQKTAAIDFFSEKGQRPIFPDVLKERTLLNREFEALTKLGKSQKLQNEHLKEFIFNSSRAQASEEFIGMSSDDIAVTPQYLDCNGTQMLSLNQSQQEAVVKGLYAKDLCLLQGPPGTGKTTVISELIWQHIRKNQQIRIMLTSQTNLAIDNALNRLFSNSAVIEGSSAWRNMMLIKPLRKADKEKIEEEGAPFSEDRINDWIEGNGEEAKNNIVCRWMHHIAQRAAKNVEYEDVLSEWLESLHNPSLTMRKIFANQYGADSNVLCMTCGKVGSQDFRNYEAGKGFDVVIVDEASKATLPELLMPLCYARKSIIIGDHRQLPPVIFEGDFFQKIQEINPELEATLDQEFKHELVDESLFKRLITHPFLSPTIKATFNVQYRMHPDINAVISQFYKEDSGGLSCGLDIAKVDDPDFSQTDSRYHGLSLDHFIQPNVHTIWVDVPDGYEQGGEGSSSFNEKEVEAVELVIKALANADGFHRYMNYWSECGNLEKQITESKIGVISFYAAQVQKIRSAIQSFCDRNKIKVSTKSVDKFQGQESGIVVVSTVRTRKLGFTRTPERLNVALSRARRLLIIVGNSNFYSSDRAKTEDGRLIYRNVIERIQNDRNSVFIDYRELKKLL